MAAIEKQINARFQLKYDSFANWNAKNPELKAGEVAIAYLGDTINKTETGHGNNHPVLFKVGPGNFNSLPWVSALAADVHTWAKKTEDEFKTWVKGLVEVTDIDAYSKGEIDGLLSAKSQADQKYAKDYADGLAKNYATADQGAKADSAVQKVTVLGHELANGGSVTVEQAKTDLGLKSAAYEEASAFDAAGAAAAVLGTNADEAGAATVHGALKAAAAAQADIDAFFNAAEKGEAALDTLKEIQDFLAGDAEGTVKELLDDVAANAGAIEDIVDGTTKVAAAANADVAAKASGLDAAGEAAVKAVKVDNAGNADQLGGVAAANYLQKSDAPGYADILTKTDAATLYQPVGDYATAAQGQKADSALQEIKTTANGGLKVTNGNQIDIDPDVVFVFYAGDASTLVD